MLSVNTCENLPVAPALWNACPMKCNAYFIGAKPIPLGWLRQMVLGCPI